MSDIIQLLPDHIANQIAAGEVIQRPASVVKELLENAIDAGATKVDVNIKDAGKSLIQVVDNGKGMSQSDAILCFARHATSKVRKADDLFALTTKGFRGEALASIAAIAHVELKTKQKANATGNKIVIEGSKVTNKEECVCPNGTSFEIKNLFYNVPARRNFLKKESTEFRHVLDEFERIALSHPEIHLTLTHNGTELFNLNAEVLRKRIVNILGKGSNDKLVPIEESTDIVTLKGYVLKPEHSRKTRGEQYFFVNDRYFKSSYFNHAITKAFDGLLKNGTFPGYFLYMDIDPQKIDVNVHPTKTEIKFEEDKFIYSIIVSSVRLALGKYNIAPTLEFEQENSFNIPHSMRNQTPIEPSVKVNENYNPFTSNATKTSSGFTGKKTENYTSGIASQGFGQETAKTSEWDSFYTIEEESETANLELGLEVSGQSSYIIKGNYVFAPSKSGLMAIHAKRAIEQIVYTDISNSFISNPITSQQLLFPIEKEVSKNEKSSWLENQSILNQLGFESIFKENVLVINAVPAVLQEETISNSIGEIFSTIAYQEIEKGDLAHTLIGAIAKSASMKKINLSTPEMIQSLIDQLFQCENHTYSPRNKKIIASISLDEINTKFK